MNATSAAIWNRMYLARLSYSCRPYSTARDDGGEVVVGQDHHRRVLGHFGAGDAHRDADVGLLERRCVVHSVTGHGDDVGLPLQRADQADLVLRRHAGNDADVVEFGDQLLVAHGGELRARQRLARDAELVADRRSGHRVVASDHPHLDAGAMALFDGHLRLGTGRVDDADHGQQCRVRGRRRGGERPDRTSPGRSRDGRRPSRAGPARPCGCSPRSPGNGARHRSVWTLRRASRTWRRVRGARREHPSRNSG